MIYYHYEKDEHGMKKLYCLDSRNFLMDTDGICIEKFEYSKPRFAIVEALINQGYTLVGTHGERFLFTKEL